MQSCVACTVLLVDVCPIGNEPGHIVSYLASNDCILNGPAYKVPVKHEHVLWFRAEKVCKWQSTPTYPSGRVIHGVSHASHTKSGMFA